MACHCRSCFFRDYGEYDSEGHFGYGEDYGGYDGYGRHASNGVSYGNFAEKSNAACNRELTAKNKFKALADATPANISGGNH